MANVHYASNGPPKPVEHVTNSGALLTCDDLNPVHRVNKTLQKQMNVVSSDLRERERKMYKQFQKFVVQNQKFLSSLKKRRTNKLPDCEDIKHPLCPPSERMTRNMQPYS